MNKSKRPNIGELRIKIDDLDRELIRVLNDRASYAIAIGKIKRKKKLPIYDPKREEQIIKTVIRHNKGPLDGEGTRRLFERIIDESRRIERVTAEKNERRVKAKRD